MIIKKSIFLILIIILGSSFGLTLEPGEHALTFISTYDGSTEPYLLYVPSLVKSNISLPLAVVLHGRGADQNAWFKYTPVTRYAEEYGYIIVSPYARGDYWYRGPGEQDVLDIINEVQSQLNVNHHRIYLLGHSMGGWGTWRIALRHPDIFASISPMSGPAPLELLPNARHLSPLIIHSEDDPVVNVRESRRAAEELSKIGFSHQYIEPDGFGHSSKLISEYLPTIFEWFNKHHRIMKVTKFEYVTRFPPPDNIYFTRILKTYNFPEKASLSVTMETTNHLSMETKNIAELAFPSNSLPMNSQSPMKMKINKKEFIVPLSGNWVKLHLDGNGIPVKYSYSNSTPNPFKNPKIASIRVEWLKDTSTWKYSDAMGKILINETKADIFLALDGMFKIPAGPVTDEKVLDFFLYPENELVSFRLKGSELLKPMNFTNQPVRFYPVETKINPKKNYEVIAPIRISRSLKIEGKVLPKSISEYLLEGIRKKKTIP